MLDKEAEGSVEGEEVVEMHLGRDSVHVVVSRQLNANHWRKRDSRRIERPLRYRCGG